MGAAGNIAQNMPRRKNPNPNMMPNAGVVTPDDPSMLVSKPSMAKIYSKKGKRTEY